MMQHEWIAAAMKAKLVLRWEYDSEGELVKVYITDQSISDAADAVLALARRTDKPEPAPDDTLSGWAKRENP